MNAEDNPFNIPLETRRRLSTSLIWQAQRNYFERAGIDAWRGNTVPHYITNNPRLAAAYAQVLLGFVRDLCRQPAPHDQPLHIVELGAGCGRFGFFFLKLFSELLGRPGLPHMRFRYVMTDFAESNLAFLRGHEALRPLVERGILDFARFDVEKDYELRLEHTGETLGPGSLQNPLVVIANYVFDGVSQDAFLIREGQIFEHLISIYSDVPSPDLSLPDIFQHLAVLYDDSPAARPYYAEPEFNEVLDVCAQTMKEGSLLFPCSALRCARRLATLSAGRMILLAGDKGEPRQDFPDGPPDPAFAMHGSFSMNVNYNALNEYFTREGGEALTPGNNHAGLHISAFLAGLGRGKNPETQLGYEQAIGGGAIDDFFGLRRGIQEHYDKLELKHLLALLRLSGFDPKIMSDCLPVIWMQLDSAGPLKDEIADAALQVRKNYFHLGEPDDLLFKLGGLLYGLGEYRHALHLFEDSCRLYGDDPRTVWNIGLCHCGLRNTQDATECFSRALNSEGEFSPRGGLQEKRISRE